MPRCGCAFCAEYDRRVRARWRVLDKYGNDLERRYRWRWRAALRAAWTSRRDPVYAPYRAARTPGTDLSGDAIVASVLSRSGTVRDA